VKAAHGRQGHPAQLKPPRGVQDEPLEKPESPDENEATVESFLRVFWLWQPGQSGRRSASEKRTIFSNSNPHSLQRYSYKGIGFLSCRKVKIDLD
jgi:hypothetical protein